MSREDELAHARRARAEQRAEQRRADDRLGMRIGALVVLAAVLFGTWVVVQSWREHQQCRDAGGVMVRGTCLERDAVVDLP